MPASEFFGHPYQKSHPARDGANPRLDSSGVSSRVQSCPRGRVCTAEKREEEKEQRPSSRSRSCDHFSSARPYNTTLLYQRRTAAAQLPMPSAWRPKAARADLSVTSPALPLATRARGSYSRTLLACPGQTPGIREPHSEQCKEWFSLAPAKKFFYDSQRRWWWLAVRSQSGILGPRRVRSHFIQKGCRDIGPNVR